MKLTRVLLSSAAVIAMAGAAQAADLIIDEPVAIAPVSSAYDWSGAYVGIFAAGTAGTVDYTGDYDDTPAVDPDVTGDVDLSGWQIGGAVGVNFQADNVVFGVEGDLAWADITGTNDIPGSASDATGNVDWLGTIRGRVGFAVDTVLLYATGGFAFGGGTVEISDIDGIVDGVEDASFTGWTAGFGAEVALSDNLSLKGEYLYTSLNNDDVVFSDTDYALGGSLSVDSDVAAHTVKLGLNYSF